MRGISLFGLRIITKPAGTIQSICPEFQHIALKQRAYTGSVNIGPDFTNLLYNFIQQLNPCLLFWRIQTNVVEEQRTCTCSNGANAKGNRINIAKVHALVGEGL